MDCTKCGAPLEEAVCGNCSRDHKELLYKLADDAQVRRDYEEASEYMELVKKSTSDTEEINNINRILAKLDFAQTDLTGATLQKNKRLEGSVRVLRFVFTLLVIISLLLITYTIYEENNNSNRFEIIEIK